MVDAVIEASYRGRSGIDRARAVVEGGELRDKTVRQRNVHPHVLARIRSLGENHYVHHGAALFERPGNGRLQAHLIADAHVERQRQELVAGQVVGLGQPISARMCVLIATSARVRNCSVRRVLRARCPADDPDIGRKHGAAGGDGTLHGQRHFGHGDRRK